MKGITVIRLGMRGRKRRLRKNRRGREERKMGRENVKLLTRNSYM